MLFVRGWCATRIRNKRNAPPQGDQCGYQCEMHTLTEMLDKNNTTISWVYVYLVGSLTK